LRDHATKVKSRIHIFATIVVARYRGLGSNDLVQFLSPIDLIGAVTLVLLRVSEITGVCRPVA
jgi:hypothetical protein